MSACGELVDELLRRVRDPQGTANPRAVVRDLLDRTQVLFVRATGTLITEFDSTITPERLVYDLDPALYLRILDIFLDDKRLWPITWPQMDAQRGTRWWRGTSNAGPKVWAPLGTTHYIIYPATTVLTGNLTVSLRVQNRPAALSADDVPMEIPNEFYPRVLDYVEALLLLRQRDPALEAAIERVGGERAEPAHEEVA